MQTSSQREMWEIYARAWSETDHAKRQLLLEQSVNPNCLYTDPITQVQGHDALSGYMVEFFQKNIPGGRFVTTDFQEHHEQSLPAWNMVDSQDHTVTPGTSFVTYDANGRLMQMTGFFVLPADMTSL